MSTEVNPDLRAAHVVIRGLKVVVTGVAALVAVALLIRGWAEAPNDQDGFVAIATQGMFATVLVVLMVGIGWALIMLPLWLIAGLIRKR